MKKQSLITLFAFAAMSANAQFTLYQGGNIGICSTSLTPNSDYMLYVQSVSTDDWATAILGDGPGPISANHGSGVTGRDSTGASGGFTYGVYGSAYNIYTNGAGWGRNYGVYGLAGNASGGYNYGVYGTCAGSQYGAGVFGTNSVAGDYYIPGVFAGYFNGWIGMTQDYAVKLSTNTWSVSSDRRLKKNITPFSDGLNVIRKINPVRYQFSGIGGLPTKDTNIGVLAQDVQKVARYCIDSNLVIMKQSDAAAYANNIVSSFRDTNGTPMVVVNSLTMNTHGLFYAMLNSIKQLDSTVSKLDSTVTNLQEQLNQCCSNQNEHHSVMRKDSEDGTGTITDTISTKIELANNSSIILYQNQPNPFNGSTVIRYFIPVTFQGSMYISFADAYGNEIKRMEITSAGFGKIEIGTANLISGIYTYSMVVNGNVIDTKKMIKDK